MSDFLGRCAARALGMEPSLQPRLASRFEPEAAGPVGADLLPSASGELSRETPALAGPPPDLTPDPSPIAPPASGRGAPPPGTLTPGPSPASGRGVQSRERASLPPLPGAGNQPAEGRGGEGGRGGEVGRGEAPDTPDVLWREQPPRSQVHLLPAFPRPTSPPTPLPSPPHPPGEGSHRPGTLTPGPSPASGRGVQSRERASLPPLPEAGNQPAEGRGGEGGRGGEVGRGEAAAPDTREVSVASRDVQQPPARSREAGIGRLGELGVHEEPPIRVTIGRIEVRAAAPAPPPAPRPAAGPRMSLEDYLRRRSEGRL